MVYRIYVEKKSGLDNEARALLGEISAFLGIKSVERVRILNRYDAENITEELFNYVIRVAEGEETRNEINGYREISIFKDGVVL